MGDNDARKQAQVEKLRHLVKAVSIVRDTLAWAKKGVNRNPSPEQRRQLDQLILDLAAKIAILDARIIALRSAGAENVAMPSPEQIAATGALAADVEALTNDSLTAASALSVATRGLKLATDLTA